MMPTMFRSLLVTVVAAALVAVAAPAGAQHRDNLYCSDTGDLCQSTRLVGGTRKLTIVLAERYFTNFHLCVKDPDGYRVCAPFRIQERDNGTFGRSVDWRRHFPAGGPGAYTVSWRVGDDRIGRRLGFHVG